MMELAIWNSIYPAKLPWPKVHWRVLSTWDHQNDLQTQRKQQRSHTKTRNIGFTYPLVMTNVAIENDHRNVVDIFPLIAWWIFPVRYVSSFTRPGNSHHWIPAGYPGSFVTAWVSVLISDSEKNADTGVYILGKAPIIEQLKAMKYQANITCIIELDDGNIYRKPLYLMVKTMVSCKISLKPIQWMYHVGYTFSISFGGYYRHAGGKPRRSAPGHPPHKERFIFRPEPKNGWFRIESPIEIDDLYWFVASGKLT